jgi:hypothetical protein
MSRAYDIGILAIDSGGVTRCLGPSRVGIRERTGGYILKSYRPQFNTAG